MRISPRLLVIAAAALVTATPAIAGTGFPVPEPGDVSLFALGFAGLLIGRRAASKRSGD